MEVTPEENNAYCDFVRGVAKETGVLEDGVPETLWHYTDTGGFLGIINSGTMYATQVSTLNDSAETEYAVNLFREEVKKIMVLRRSDTTAVHFFQNILDYIRDEPESPTQGISKFFVTCFSSLKDDLNQWSKYTGKSPGQFAIGFDSGDLNRACNRQLFRVVYDRNKQEQAVRKLVEATLRFFLEGLTGERLQNPTEWAKVFYAVWDEWIYKFAPLAKDKHWDTEWEHRIVYEYRLSDLSRLKFRQKSNILARYLELQFATRLPISAVVVGPGMNQALSKMNVRFLLEQKGYQNVDIGSSLSTLRD